jgi:hypothetical protein
MAVVISSNPRKYSAYTPIIDLDSNNSVLIQDDIGRQTIINMSSSEYSPVYSPVYTPVNTYGIPPLVGYEYQYQDINEDSTLHQKVMKKIYTNFYNFIIPNQFPHLLNYVKNSKNGYTIVSSKKKYRKNKTRENEYENKLQYIARNVYSKLDMYKDVKNYIDVYDVKWYELDDKKKDVFEMLINKLKQKLEDLLR